MTIYEVGDSLLFTDGQSMDTIVVSKKILFEPRNRFGLDWEGHNILIGGIQSYVIYDFDIIHDASATDGAIVVSKKDDGLEVTSSIGGMLLQLSSLDLNPEDVLYGDLSMFDLAGNWRRHIPNFWSCKITPKDGLIEYSFKDGRIYKLIKRIPVKDSKYYQEHKAE